MDAIELYPAFYPLDDNFIASLFNTIIIGDVLAVQENCRMRCKNESLYVRKILLSVGTIKQEICEDTLGLRADAELRFVD